MAADLPTFKIRFPEFALTLGITTDPDPDQDVRLSAVLAASEAFHDRNLFSSPAQADEAVMFYAAHVLARSPFAVNARIQKSRGDADLVTGEDVYEKHYVTLIRAAACGNRVP